MGEALHHCFTRATQFVFPWPSKLHISLGLKNRLSLCWKESLETITLVKFHDPDPTWITNVGNNWITMKRVSVLSCFSHVWLCDPMDCRPPGSSVRGILQARILEWVAMLSSRGSSQPRDQTQVSYISCIGRWVLYHQHHLGSPQQNVLHPKPVLSQCGWFRKYCKVLWKWWLIER